MTFLPNTKGNRITMSLETIYTEAHNYLHTTHALIPILRKSRKHSRAGQSTLE